jgi:hypothetical protein
VRLNRHLVIRDQMGARNKDLKSGVLDLMTTSKQPTDPEPNRPRRAPMLPWVWLALTVVATVGWLIAIGWATVAFARWLLD